MQKGLPKMARTGIEPVTLGLWVLCSSTELPSQITLYSLSEYGFYSNHSLQKPKQLFIKKSLRNSGQKKWKMLIYKLARGFIFALYLVTWRNLVYLNGTKAVHSSAIVLENHFIREIIFYKNLILCLLSFNLHSLLLLDSH